TASSQPIRSYLIAPSTYVSRFPYTTLFRSLRLGHGAGLLGLEDLEIAGDRSEGRRQLMRQVLHELATPLTPITGYLKILKSEKTDRKSTRLNSSHVAIAYAVFCLKKKNNKH